MRNRFKKLWNKCDAKSDADQIFEDLERRYSEPNRFYHNFQHIEACFNQMDMISSDEIDPLVLEFSLWFHDAVYNPKAKDNEEQSAQLAKSVCKHAELPESFCQKAQELILVTKHTCDPIDYLQQIILDIDLSILGSDPRTYDFFEMNIRKEYSHVNEPDFLAGRSRILNGFINRNRVFYTDVFYSKYETCARSNLSRTIQKLLPSEIQ
jgi:predicted metal-dependent HD superfamily phosphohydrolase